MPEFRSNPDEEAAPPATDAVPRPSHLRLLPSMEIFPDHVIGRDAQNEFLRTLLEKRGLIETHGVFIEQPAGPVDIGEGTSHFSIIPLNTPDAEIPLNGYFFRFNRR